ncbi:MAG: glycerol kinase GlpK, partial [Acidobacteria bacterium]|nr:glycerol kinase GlpK [Acidobacteriota bacterium]
VEHDPEEIWSSQIDTGIAAIKSAGLDQKDIAAIGITNQRETTLIWDRKTGIPIYNAIVWQDRRTSKFCDSIRVNYGELIRGKTGLEVDAYFSASKINWMLNNVPGARTLAENGELCFGTVDSWLVWKLTQGRTHVTDISNASRTMLFNIHDLCWDRELLRIFDIPEQILPDVRASSEIIDEVSEPRELNGISIAGMIGDQQAALFGQLCMENGETKNTYGTGCFMLQNTGKKAIRSKNRLLTTIAWKIGDEIEYALEGSVFIGGAVVQWLRDSLEVISSSDEVEALANSVEDNGGVYFVPAFTGLGTPYWDQDARGMMIGLTRGTKKGHIARAALESIAFQTADLLKAVETDSGIHLAELRVDGGATSNESLLQFQADILQIPIVRSKISETTALGAAYLAGLAVGYWSSKEDLKAHWESDKKFFPRMPASDAADLRGRWDQAVKRSLRWELRS